MTDGVLNSLVQKIESWLEAAVLMAPNLAAALIIVGIAWLLARVASGLTVRVLRRTTPYDEIARLLSGVVWAAVLCAGLFIALGVLQLDKTVTSLVAGAGLLTLIIGLAFQDLAANFIAGVLLQLRHPFRRGHLVETNEFYGIIEGINLRTTILRTLTGQVALIPNKTVFENPVVNYSTSGRRRIDLKVGVSYGDDLERVKETAIAAVAAVQGRDAEREPELFYEGFGESSIDFTVRFWIPFSQETDYLQARSEAVMRVKRAFDEAGITIPFPIRTLDFSAVGGTTLREEWTAAGGGSNGR